jgi:hypothetical protein
MIIPELLVKSLSENNIQSEYINSSMVKINHIFVSITGNCARFGTVSLSFVDLERLIHTLDRECLISITKQQKSEILSTYSYLEVKQRKGEIAKQADGYNKYGVPDKNTIKTLSDIGISRKDSSTFQTLAKHEPTEG